MLNFARPSQWAPTERAPLPAACVQPRVVRLMRDAVDVGAPTAPMLLSAHDPWPNTRGEIHDTRPDILIDDVPCPCSVVRRLTPTEPTHLPHMGHRPNDDESNHEIAAAQEVGIRRAPRSIVEYTEPPRRVPWLACAIGAALFAVGYFVGRVLP